VKTILIFLQIIVLVGIGYVLLEDTINMDPEITANIDYENFVGKYEFIEEDSDGYKIHWVQLNEDGTYKDHQRRSGFYLVEGDTIFFYQKIIAFYRLYSTTRVISNSFQYNDQIFALPSPFESPDSFNFFHRLIYWSPVKYANAYEVFVDGELYKQVSDTWLEVDYVSSDFIDVKVRAIDTNNREKNGAFTPEVSLHPNLVSQTTSYIINLAEVSNETNIIIPSNVYIIEINGLPGVTYQNIYIEIQERESNLLIILNDVIIDNSSSNVSKAVIRRLGVNPFLTIIQSNGTLNRIKGKNGGSGGNGSSGQNGSSGGNGISAVILFDVYFRGSAPINLIGGSGGRGGNGGDSGAFAQAGNGGNGGNASTAANIETVYYDHLELVHFYSGSVGSGGSGGTSGFLGSNGKSGSSGSITGHQITDFVEVITLIKQNS
jgi:uncharacterized membrane protein YgcG